MSRRHTLQYKAQRRHLSGLAGGGDEFVRTAANGTVARAPETPAARRMTLRKPYPADGMEVAEVGPVVNSPKNDGPEGHEAA